MLSKSKAHLSIGSTQCSRLFKVPLLRSAPFSLGLFPSNLFCCSGKWLPLYHSFCPVLHPATSRKLVWPPILPGGSEMLCHLQADAALLPLQVLPTPLAPHLTALATPPVEWQAAGEHSCLSMVLKEMALVFKKEELTLGYTQSTAWRTQPASA